MNALKITVSALFVFLFSCNNQQYKLSPVNSESFHGSQVEVNFDRHTAILDSLADNTALLARLDQMLSTTDSLREMKSDQEWEELINSWIVLEKIITPEVAVLPKNIREQNNGTSTFRPEILEKWVTVNSRLLKFSGEVRFADAIEKIVYGRQGATVSDSLLKSLVYTNLFDKVYINVIGNSSVSFQHTTGGNVKLIQETKYPEHNVIILKCECSDKRFLDVNIRIPSWAENPTVTHGNVKYVARPGEYCQVVRKWRNGDEFLIVLKN